MTRRLQVFRRLAAGVALAVVGCGHSDAFVAGVSSVGPFSAGPNVQLTFSADQDDWPSWSADGRGILYSFVDLEHPLHRCVGLLPGAGGTRLWQFCDNRAVRDDSLSSFPAYALDSTGHLLFTEAVGSTAFGGSGVPQTTLWIADTANLVARTPLLTLPAVVSTGTINWLSDIDWTGPASFIALGQQMSTVAHCDVCGARDSVWVDPVNVVVRGTISGTHATLQAVGGTEGATAYSLAESGASIVFTLVHDLRLYKVSAAGGTPVPTPHPAALDTAATQVGELAGVSCQGSTCIVAKDGIFLAGSYWAFNINLNAIVLQTFSATFFSPHRGMELHSVSLATGADQLLQENDANVVLVTPKISPRSGDVVFQRGGGWGHLQTFGTAASGDPLVKDGNSDLFLIKGIVP